MSRRFAIYIFLLSAIVLSLRIIIIPWYDNNFGGIEPNVIYGIQRILQGQPLYQDPAAGTYAIIQYTPLWYHFVACVAWIVSSTAFDHGLDVHGLYMLCRVLALMFNMLTMTVCVLTLRKWGLGWLQALAGALPVLICFTTHYYTRGDSMHLFFFVLAVIFYLLSVNKRGFFHLLFAAVFTACCVAAKQSGVLCAGTICYNLLFMERRYYAAVIYLLSTGIMTLLVLYSFTGGDWYLLYQNAWLGLKNGIDSRFLYDMFISRFFMDMVPCYLLAGVMVYYAAKYITDKLFRVMVGSVVICWLFAAITGLKVGSSNNYFTEFLVMVVFTVPYLLYAADNKVLFHAGKRAMSVRVFTGITLFILITSKTAGLATSVFARNGFRNDKAEYLREQALYNYFRDELHIKKGEHIFFTERFFLDNLFIEYATMPIKDVVTQVYITDSTTFDYSGFTKQINSGAITYIVTSERRNDINVCSDSLPFILFDKDKFIQVAHVAGFCVYQYTQGQGR